MATSLIEQPYPALCITERDEVLAQQLHMNRVPARFG
jgi:hypothetical protein